MIRTSILTVAALAASTLAWAPPAHSQRTAVSACVDLRTEWYAYIRIEQRNAPGDWIQLLYVSSFPGQRHCAELPQEARRVRFTLQRRVDGVMRSICQAEALSDRSSTLRVLGTTQTPLCQVIQ